MRFGKTLVVEDADVVEPMLFPLLRRDLFHSGSRRAVAIGAKTVEYDPAFRLFLVTRNPTPVRTPNLRGLVAEINFTITRAGLEAQLLVRVCVRVCACVRMFVCSPCAGVGWR